MKKQRKSKNKTSRIIFSILFIVIVAVCCYYYDSTKSDVSIQTPQTSDFILLSPSLEIPSCPLKNHADDHEIRNFKYYSLCYRESYEQAEWSAYCLLDSQLIKNAERTNDFRPDSQISTGSAELADYRKSGYDRGHLTPAADMAFSEEAMSETFFMSNMSPQTPKLNRGVWKDLEAQVRLWVKKFGRAYVVSGPVLNKPADGFSSIGKNHVCVPDFYYKVILVPLYKDDRDLQTPDDAENIMAIGFIIPNQDAEGEFWNYAVSIDEVEQISNIDFYYLLPDSVEDVVEADFDISRWN